jgi:hypothetical protein
MGGRCFGCAVVHQVDEGRLIQPNAGEVGLPFCELIRPDRLHAEKVHEERERTLLVVYQKDDVVDVHNVASQFPVD